MIVGLWEVMGGGLVGVWAGNSSLVKGREMLRFMRSACWLDFWVSAVKLVKIRACSAFSCSRVGGAWGCSCSRSLLLEIPDGSRIGVWAMPEEEAGWWVD